MLTTESSVPWKMITSPVYFTSSAYGSMSQTSA